MAWRVFEIADTAADDGDLVRAPAADLSSRPRVQRELLGGSESHGAAGGLEPHLGFAKTMSDDLSTVAKSPRGSVSLSAFVTGAQLEGSQTRRVNACPTPDTRRALSTRWEH